MHMHKPYVTLCLNRSSKMTQSSFTSMFFSMYMTWNEKRDILCKHSIYMLSCPQSTHFLYITVWNTSLNVASKYQTGLPLRAKRLQLELNWPQTTRQSSIVDREIHCRTGRSACPFDCICSHHRQPRLPFDTLPLYGGCPHHSSWSTAVQTYEYQQV